jgi:hypothetical protein
LGGGIPIEQVLCRGLGGGDTRGADNDLRFFRSRELKRLFNLSKALLKTT